MELSIKQGKRGFRQLDKYHMRNKFSLIIWIQIFLFFSLNANAQKKEMAQARIDIKSGKNLDRVEQSMKQLLKDSTNRINEKIWLLLFEAQRKIYEQGNEKLYLKQKYDTAKLFNSCLNLFTTLEGLDSLDARPDKKGEIKLKYRLKHSELLNTYRPNLYNGGIYFLNKQNYQTAYHFLDTYINCAEQPLFSSYNYLEKDTLLPVAAYWAVYCGYKMADTKATLHHTYLALKDTAHYAMMLQYLAETYKLENDTSRYVQTLEEGFFKYPKFPFFFPRLIEHYSASREYTKAFDICKQALKADSTNVIFRFATSTVLLNMRRYTECINLCEELLKQDNSMVDAYLNLGLAYFNQGIEIEKKTQDQVKKKKMILQSYRAALPYLEKYKKFEPTQREKWGLPLYTIYLNLNMGKEFDEIDHILKQKR